MAKQTTKSPTTTTPTDEFAALRSKLDTTSRDGAATQNEDVDGYWDPDQCPIFCIPRTAKIFDSKIEPRNPSILAIVELSEDCIIYSKKEEGEDEPTLSIARKGAMVGVWVSAGMKLIRNYAGVEIKLYFAGTKDTGKPSPMKVFKIEAVKKGSRIPVTDDARKRSKETETDLVRSFLQSGPVTDADIASDANDSDNVPF